MQRDGPAFASGGLVVSAGDTLRACRNLQAEGRWRRAGKSRRHRGHVIGLPRWLRRAEQPRDGHVRRVRSGKRLWRRMLPRIQHATGRQRQVRLPLSPDPYDRSRTWHLGRLGSPAQGSDRRANLLQLGRCRDRQASTQGRRNARRRGRLLRLGQANAGHALAEGRLPATRPRTQREAQA